MEQPTETLINETAKCRESVYGDVTYEKKEKPPTCICLCTQTPCAEQRHKKLVPGVVCEEGLSGEEKGKGDITLVSILIFEPCEVLPIPK